MTRIFPVVALAGLVLLCACGAPKASAAGSATSPSPNRGAIRNGAAGQLVQINGQQLIVTAATGDTIVDLTGSTTFTHTSVAALADIVPGSCIVATGRKDASGALTATTVRISPKVATGCAAGGPGFGGGPRGSPRPVTTPRPTPSGSPNAAFVAGQVTAATGVSITVLTAASGSQVITVPTTATITKTATSSATDLQRGLCLVATGPKDSSGAIQATSVTITPAGPSGTCSTGFGGGGFRRGGVAPSGAPAAG